MHFVETADCETDGDVSSSCLQDPPEAGGVNAPATPPTAHTSSPAVNGLSIPALRFPSVSGFNEELVIKVEDAGRWRDGGLYKTSFFQRCSICPTQP